MSNSMCVVLHFYCLDYSFFIAFPESSVSRKLMKTVTVHGLTHAHRRPDALLFQQAKQSCFFSTPLRATDNYI